jgi:hypothetical protein
MRLQDVTAGAQASSLAFNCVPRLGSASETLALQSQLRSAGVSKTAGILFEETFVPTLEQQEIAVLKGRVNRLEARLEFLYKHLGVTFIEDTRPTDDPRIIEALKANNLLEAIKLYRMATNASLEAAKAGVEDMRARLGI